MYLGLPPQRVPSNLVVIPATTTRTVLITGCSSGIGLCVARGQRSCGYHVIATARKAKDVQRLTDEGFDALPLDLDDSASIRQAVSDGIAMELTSPVIRHMREQGGGRIIHNSSVLGLVAFPYRGAYTATKFALKGITDTERTELRDTGILVHALESRRP